MTGMPMTAGQMLSALAPLGPDLPVMDADLSPLTGFDAETDFASADFCASSEPYEAMPVSWLRDRLRECHPYLPVLSEDGRPVTRVRESQYDDYSEDEDNGEVLPCAEIVLGTED